MIVPQVIVPVIEVPIIEVPIIEVPTTQSLYEVIECESEDIEVSFTLSSDSDEEYGSTSSSCNDCGSTLVCTKCAGTVTTDPVFEEIQIVETPIMNTLCDIQIVKDQVYLTHADSSVVAMPSSKINVIDYEYVSRESKGFYPIVSMSECEGVSVPLSDYRCKNNEAKQFYGHASGNKVLRKVIVDNNLRF